jgi:hypothetical protein
VQYRQISVIVDIRSVRSTVSVRYLVSNSTHGQINGAWVDSSLFPDIYVQSYILQTKTTLNANEQNSTTASRITICLFMYELTHLHLLLYLFSLVIGKTADNAMS